MKETITVKAEARAASGTNPVGRLRQSGQLPGVVYSEGKPAEMIQTDLHAFRSMLKHHHGEHMIMDLVVGGGAPRKVLLKEVQHDPIMGHPIHVDFYAVNMSRKVRVDIPVRLTGIPIGVSNQGGILDHLLREVEVECLPGDLMEEIVVDVAALELGKHLSVADIRLDASKYRMVTAGEIAIAAVSAPKEEEVAAPAEGEAAAAGPEVIGEKKAEEGEAAEGAAPAKGGKPEDKKAGGKPDDKKAGKPEEAKGEKKEAKKEAKK